MFTRNICTIFITDLSFLFLTDHFEFETEILVHCTIIPCEHPQIFSEFFDTFKFDFPCSSLVPLWRRRGENISSATTPSCATNATTKKINFKSVKKFWENFWMFTRNICTIYQNFSLKFEMSSEKQKRQICYE